MANRLYLDVNGLKISRTGLNVLSGNPNDMMFDSTVPSQQWVQVGSVILSNLVGSDASGYYWNDVTIPNQGYTPFIMFFYDTAAGGGHLSHGFNSNTSVRFKGRNGDLVNSKNARVIYLVTNQRAVFP